jgi:hypothetical protein
MELRRGRRLPLQLAVSFISDEVTGTGIIYNLSKEGCAIESETYMPINSYLELGVRLSPDESPVLIEFAVVRWSTRTEFGAEFLTLSDDSKKRIVKYVAATA